MATTLNLRRVALAVILASLAWGAAGCSSSFDGSSSFNQAHPEYQDRPAYFDHNVGGTAAHPSGD